MLSTLPFDTPDQVIAQASGGAAAVTAVAGAGSRVAMESARRAAAQGLIEPVRIDGRHGRYFDDGAGQGVGSHRSRTADRVGCTRVQRAA